MEVKSNWNVFQLDVNASNLEMSQLSEPCNRPLIENDDEDESDSIGDDANVEIDTFMPNVTISSNNDLENERMKE